MRRAVLLAGALGLLAAAAPAVAKVGPLPISAVSGAVWASTPPDGLVRIAPADGRPVGSVTGAGAPWSMEAADGRLWSLGQDGRVARRSAAGAVEAEGRAGGNAQELAVGATSVWVLTYRGPQGGRPVLVRLDRDTLRPRGLFHLGRRAVRLAAAEARVWLALDPVGPGRRGALVALDESSGAVTARLRLRGAVRDVAADDRGGVVVVERGPRAQVVAADTAGRLRWRVASPAITGLLAPAGDRLWVGTLCGGPTCRLDRASVRALDASNGQLVAGPHPTWRPCRGGTGRGPTLFPAGLAATEDGAYMSLGDGTGGVRVAHIRTEGVRWCARV